MQKCKYCHDNLQRGWNYTPDMGEQCHYCFYEIDDDLKYIDQMEFNEEMGRPDKKLARAYQRYLES